MKVTKALAAEVADKLSPAARNLLLDMFAKPQAPVKVQADEFRALIELMAKKLMRADMSWDNEPVTVLERGGKFVLEVLKAQNAGRVTGKDGQK